MTDVDGVLTDGGRYYSSHGEELKKFHTRDGMGVNILLRNGIKTCIVTKEKSKIVFNWAKQMNISKTYSGVIRKEQKLNLISTNFKILPSEIAYIGDDVNDLELLKQVGFSVAPHDAIKQIQDQVDYVCELSGGNGAFREFADLILKIKYPTKKDWY